ncbi:MAG: GTP-binding protein [Candidatus Altiarchaeum hamiconexum]|uniref:GTP-binding protein n=1 Tax=Candidatus Altarchaeum hamiconexum TaxID=1803513 RepID=A0A8J7YWE4_9ARCH|nr:GTP-binding protein [Candidatus Altarchaeum hamiconexum]OIQ04977.1 MAG: hypothetical protein AUK59_05635 [Candidatus Altarchaeum sp. CG2_30_32_3053]PIN67092.1 MAG: GTP-binding protein [Candidatus Altarchaeum sp. CG12_big_fil_rev_8_21_14_0_65_33_22]PIV27435.1 MAG: GTP-binding protein [Candidatus Altarchaeum sp. CG03_land_8_20_14_0_80_32_618]PIX48559.1 MAG: GTP-binding protein [Candidatus Altarchaeum sp. CG_4_8_14_3_um_filter_33_2054]PIZ32542.1 MAG: GTP-binding protein [Candidatus Altarchaeum
MGTVDSIKKKIKDIEDEIKKTQYNKATEHHIGKLKAKIAILKEKEEIAGKGGGKREGFDVRKSGNASVSLLGFPSVGKSTLLNALTNTASKTAAYAFTTLTVVPGMLEYDGAKIQILDLPGIISGAAQRKGRGREVLAVVRNSDLILIIVDPLNLKHYDALKKELHAVGIRLNKSPPRVSITKNVGSGIVVVPMVKLTKLNGQIIKEILNTFNIFNAYVVLNEDVDEDEFIDAVVGNRKYTSVFVIVNKIDLVNNVTNIKKELVNLGIKESDYAFVSAEKKKGTDKLKEKIFKKLNFIKVFTKPVGSGAPDKEPLIMKDGSTIADFCDAIHMGMRYNFRFAIISGKSAKFSNQRVGLEHILEDNDVVTLVADR